MKDNSEVRCVLDAEQTKQMKILCDRYKLSRTNMIRFLIAKAYSGVAADEV